MANSMASTDLLPKQAALLDHLVKGVPAKVAAELAGYASVQSVYDFLRSEKCAIAYQERMAQQLALGAPVMFSVLRDIATNRAAPAGARVDAAKAWLDRAGWQVPRQVDKPRHDKLLSEMSADELKQTVLELKAIQAEPASDDPEDMFR